MARRNSINVLLLAFAVVMVLLRPYAAYRISMYPNFAGDPVKVNSLLQRLIKKKDEHHATDYENLEAIVPAAAVKSFPCVLMLFLFHAFAFMPLTIKRGWQIFKAFQSYTHPKYYLSFSCIRL
jgi:hypothetical protein